MNYFWKDGTRDMIVSYDEFFLQLVEEGANRNYIKEENPYVLFLKLLRNLINGENSIILDADFSEAELESLEVTGGQINKAHYFQPSLKDEFMNFEEILQFLESINDKVYIEIFTSGTTGKPKKVSQSLLNLTRAVKKDMSFRNNVWGFAYNSSHFAGLQVFFQALYNQNYIVYIFNSDYKLVETDLVENKVTHLSCTPTYLKMLIPNIVEPVDSVLNITSGGEKFDSRVINNLKILFPNAKIKNVYASTEAGSLLRANGEFFTIPERYQKLIMIVDEELLVNKELLGNSESFELFDDWYKTGDIVEFKDDLKVKFRFKSRKSEMINVGGYKVNPEEIETIIQKVEGVIDVLVFGRKNSIMGNIIEVNIIKDISFSDREIKSAIKKEVESLQEFKRPRVVKFVENFELTRTGKLKKNI
jgi:acyl-coenzyme A synthetase/AMP-(fatty) acid ligase